jgi:hypothetical protein
MSTTVTNKTRKIKKHQKSQCQSVDFDEDIEEMSDADLELIEQFRPKTPPVPFEKLPKELQEGIKEGLRDIDAGRVTPHEEVFRKIDEWLKNN